MPLVPHSGTFWKATGFVCLFFCVVCCTLSTAQSDDDPGADMPGVVKLTPETFTDVVGKEKAVFVEFYAPWCGHCKHMAPEYAKLGAALTASQESQERLVIAKVDGSAHGDADFKFDVKGFPTLLYFPAGSEAPEEYRSSRTADAIIDYLKSKDAKLDLFVPKPTVDVDDIDADSFESRVLEVHDRSILLFLYSSDCAECDSVRSVLAGVRSVFKYDHKVLMLQMKGDDTKNAELVESLGVHNYPTILFYGVGSRVAKADPYTGGMTVKELVSFINARAFTSRNMSGDLNQDYGLVDSLTGALHAMLMSVADPVALEENYEVFLSHGRGLRGDSVNYYVKLARRIAEDKSGAFLDAEQARWEKNLVSGKAAIAGTRRDYAMKRRNIVDAVKTARMTQVNGSPPAA